MRIVLLVVLLGLIASVACAGDFYGWDPASVDIGGQHILKFRVPAGGMSAADRRATLEFRLIKALTHTEWRLPVQMSYLPTEGGVAIHANGVFFVTATSADASANYSTPWSLAQIWGQRIKNIFEIVGPARQLPHTFASQPDLYIWLD
ncbi:MAG: hypothetical protein KKI08_18515 [Armatimonadetes bacterium]|nr:hypothetical protein [Armatimonadota bacterium]